MTPRLRHALRFLLGATLLISSAHVDARWVVITGPYFLLGTFALQHDLLHGALGLTGAVRHRLLTLVGATMLLSGHATKTMHLVHHRRCHAPEDLEGATIDGTWLRALWITPRIALSLRGAAYRYASPRDRRRQRLEHAINAATALALVSTGVPGAQVYVVLCAAFQLTMPIWAGRIPHRVPAWATRIAAVVARFGSVTAMSLAYHALHHRRPNVPTHALVGYAIRSRARALEKRSCA